jgi:glycosyltransferase involved in cell wall biosynthesis
MPSIRSSASTSHRRRVLVFTSSSAPYVGGVETFVRQLLPALRERGYEVLLVTSHHERRLPHVDDYAGVPVYRLPMRPALVNRDPMLAIRTRRALALIKRRFAADLYHVNCQGPDVVFHHETLDACPAPVLMTVHGWPFGTQSDPTSVYVKALHRADWISAPSRATLDHVTRCVVGSSARSTVIPHGIAESAEPPSRLPDRPRVLWLGRMTEEKGLDLALAAFARIASAFPTARLIVGGDGLARPSYEAMARSLGVGDRVDFLGQVEPADVPALVNRATFVVMPSRAEAFGFVALEAALQGRPVVASRVGGLPEVVVDGHTGILAPVADIDALARAITRLLHDPVATLRLGDAARARVRAMFTLERMTDAYDRLYRQLTR